MPFDSEQMYEEKFREAFRSNVADAGRAARAGELDRKIETFCELHGFDCERVIVEIESNPIVAAWFAKNPNKQNFYERTAAESIQSIRGVYDFLGPLANPKKVLVNGAVLDAQDFSDAGGSAEVKSIDFRWKYSELEFFASHKYTKESGGSQDHQFKELKSFIDVANKCADQGRYFIALADGPYYDRRVHGSNTTKLERLQQLTTQRTKACKLGELDSVMVQICSNEPHKLNPI